jgi:transposase InsO family protein
VSAAGPLSMGVYAPLSRFCAMKPRMAMDCMSWSMTHLSKHIREIAAARVRYGYRRIHLPLRREGWQVNRKRVYRLYREMGLQLRNKTPKRSVP